MLKWLQYRRVNMLIKFLHWWHNFRTKHICAEYPHNDPFMWDDDGYVP